MHKRIKFVCAPVESANAVAFLFSGSDFMTAVIYLANHGWGDEGPDGNDSPSLQQCHGKAKVGGTCTVYVEPGPMRLHTGAESAGLVA